MSEYDAAKSAGCQPSELVSHYHRAWDAIKDDPQVILEVKRARTLNPESVSPPDFLREYAWTVFNAGMRLAVIRKKWPALQDIFRQWDYQAISQDRALIRAHALRAFNNMSKVDAVVKAVDLIEKDGWPAVKEAIVNGISRDEAGNVYPSEKFFQYFPENLPWLGTTNRRFLAKNLGFDLAKNDRHLMRLAQQCGCSPDADGVQCFVKTISRLVGDRIAVVETVLFNACERGAI